MADKKPEQTTTAEEIHEDGTTTPLKRTKRVNSNLNIITPNQPTNSTKQPEAPTKSKQQTQQSSNKRPRVEEELFSPTPIKMSIHGQDYADYAPDSMSESDEDTESEDLLDDENRNMPLVIHGLRINFKEIDAKVKRMLQHKQELNYAIDRRNNSDVIRCKKHIKELMNNIIKLTAEINEDVFCEFY